MHKTRQTVGVIGNLIRSHLRVHLWDSQTILHRKMSCHKEPRWLDSHGRCFTSDPTFIFFVLVPLSQPSRRATPKFLSRQPLRFISSLSIRLKGTGGSMMNASVWSKRILSVNGKFSIFHWPFFTRGCATKTILSWGQTNRKRNLRGI